MSIAVIGSGFGRTGTASLKRALEICWDSARATIWKKS